MVLDTMTVVSGVASNLTPRNVEFLLYLWEKHWNCQVTWVKLVTSAFLKLHDCLTDIPVN